LYASIYFLLLPVLIGHLAFWCTVFNQIHATACPKSARRGSESLIGLNVVFVWVAAVYIAVVYPDSLLPRIQIQGLGWVIGAGSCPESWSNPWITTFSIYWVLCLILACVMTFRWIWRQYVDRKPRFWIDHKVQKFDFNDRSEGLINGLPTKLAFHLVPGIQLLKMNLEEKTFQLPSLPKAFDDWLEKSDIPNPVQR